ncbi:MAG: Putrescine--pyruvate aminotransferase [Gammaproteobacteria bacterium]|nr:Putrescine--pyruvate aminotransferase [Gammaproteobacteria bacterium]
MSIVPQRATAEWQEIDRRHYIHPYTDSKSLGEQGTRVITRAEGVHLWDSDGKRYIDGMSGLWCCNLGYGRRDLVEAACEQMRELPYYNSFFKTAHPPAIELAGLLAEVTPAQFKHVFYTGSGSEANDTVIRLVRRYWDIVGQPNRRIIVSRENAYHGSTIAAASLGGQWPVHEQGHLPIPNIVHVGAPYWYGCGGDLTPDAFGIEAARELETKILALGPENVAAFIGEPVQGAGGMIIPPATYWPEINRICERYGVLLIADEVICGFGRTGRWFGSERFGIKADLMSFAKGVTSGYLPLGGVMVGDRVAGPLIEQGGEFYHGFTYSGHPAACALAVANINAMRREGIVDRVHDELGPYLQRRWQEFATHPLVGEVRGVGLLAGIELTRNKATREFFEPIGDVGTVCRDFCFQNGLVMRAVRDTMIIAPPLVSTIADIDEMWILARKSLDMTAAQLGIAA